MGVNWFLLGVRCVAPSGVMKEEGLWDEFSNSFSFLQRLNFSNFPLLEQLISRLRTARLLFNGNKFIWESKVCLAFIFGQPRVFVCLTESCFKDFITSGCISATCSSANRQPCFNTFFLLLYEYRFPQDKTFLTLG